ncbi:MAG: M3 family metallopeptidase [Bdellovibrionales bacterium]|nr:M3 family metallopeptidase [Bdellovibrionales bacterium]
MTKEIIMSLIAATTLASCSPKSKEFESSDPKKPIGPTSVDCDVEKNGDNPFFKKSTLQFEYPEFDKIKDSDFFPAFICGFKEQLEEYDQIVNNPAAPTFENTIVAMQKTGALLHRVGGVYFNLESSNKTDTIVRIYPEVNAMYSSHGDKINLNPDLFSRVKTVYDNRNSSNLDSESLRLVEEVYRGFVRSGALLNEKDKARLREINAEYSKAESQFDTNVQDEVNSLDIVVESESELDGLSSGTIAALKANAEERGLPGKFVITLVNTSPQPVLSNLKNRELRKKIYEASLSRGTRGNQFDNRELFIKIAKLRAEKAKLLGYATHADYELEERTAKVPANATELLEELLPKAVANAEKEALVLQDAIKDDGGNFQLMPWDWEYYTERVKQKVHKVDDEALKPYLELNNVLKKGVFFAAEKLYGIKFKERNDLPKYRDDILTYEVIDVDGSTLALYIFDPYKRSNKRGGAWMNDFVSQSHLLGTKPVIVNNLNIVKPATGPTLMSFDEVTTLFHEFGHALHGMFSNVNYPSFSGTNVPRDFVEYPSQVNEMWATWPEVLANYAVHFETGEPIPQDILDKVIGVRKFNQGYATTAYLAASILDMKWHSLPASEIPDFDHFLDFENAALADSKVLNDLVPVRYRTTYFSHITGGYSAGYYSYIWAEVLDAHTVHWFEQNGGLTRANGDKMRNILLSRGGSTDAMGMFEKLVGEKKNKIYLLKRRGLD